MLLYNFERFRIQDWCSCGVDQNRKKFQWSSVRDVTQPDASLNFQNDSFQRSQYSPLFPAYTHYRLWNPSQLRMANRSCSRHYCLYSISTMYHLQWTTSSQNKHFHHRGLYHRRIHRMVCKMHAQVVRYLYGMRLRLLLRGRGLRASQMYLEENKVTNWRGSNHS